MALALSGLAIPGSMKAATTIDSTSRLALPGISAPCMINPPKIYLIVGQTRRHIVDWTTFSNLGFKDSDIVPCGSAASYPEGTAITRLIKGSTVDVYWMQNAYLRSIPNMATFNAL